MAEQLDAWAPSGPPPWYTPNKAAPRQNANVLRGLHPMGMPLLVQPADGERRTCGSCAHIVRGGSGGYRSKSYLKCAKARQSRAATTDIRAKWPACSLWEPAP